ncbi:hypothetical protein ACFQZS_18055 [Mucilaginibacter calamicampi]|uniref:Pectate lyase n=1 Tax=Mucilaginibacter calamicampi TaxID=1302352 RepID=A0ABW2Z2N3_9SPHI
MKIKYYAATLFALCAGTMLGHAQDIPPYTSKVYPGMDGKLVYAADSLGNKIPDFSNAGYKGGGVAIPYVPNKVTVWPVVGDCSVVIQAAIDKVSAMPLDAQGFRGAVLLKQGTYPLDKPLTIKASGVILRGEGSTEIGTILFGRTVTPRPAGNAGSSLINLAGEKGIAVQEATKQLVTDKYVPVGARSLNLASAKGFKVGDKVSVRRYGNQEWIKELGVDSASVGNGKRWRPFVTTYDRVITAVSGNTITVDAPIFTAIETRWGGGDVVKYDDNRIENVGVENLRGISEYNPTVRTSQYYNMDRPDNKPAAAYKGEEYFSDENHYRNLVTISNAKNVWVRSMSAYHFVNSVVQTNAGTKWVTIQDVESWEPVSVRQGARRFIFHLQGQLALVQRCFSQKGRHSFVLQAQEASGNVFLDCKAVNPYSTSEPHNKWANGVLYDNVKAPLTARFWDYIIGWAGANIVMWNCEGDFLIQQPPTAQNYSFGHIGTASVIYNAPLQDLSKPRGYIESLDKHVAPKSLYLTQLKERMGIEAVSNIMLDKADNFKF